MGCFSMDALKGTRGGRLEVILAECVADRVEFFLQAVDELVHAAGEYLFDFGER